jgi:membrane-associated protease RseP (regulator of RpoE activity)
VKDPLEEASSQMTRKGAGFSLLLVLAGLVVLAVVRPSTADTLAIIFGIVALIMLHECGHYYAAKRSGMKVTEFFLGFGPRVWSFRRGETEYGVKAIPAGGYVRILGMNNLEEVDPEDEPRTYRQATVGKRLWTVLAGVTVNFVLAVFLFYLAIVGQGVAGTTTTLRQIVDGTPAAEAGLQKGDTIVAVDGRRIESWEDLPDALADKAGVPTEIVYRRDGQTQSITVTPDQRSRTDSTGFLGVSPEQAFEHYGPIPAVGKSVGVMWETVQGTGEGLANLFSPSGVQQYSENFTNAPKAGSAADQERPRSIIGIVDLGSDLVDGNIWALFGLLGAINLIVGLFNLIPLLPFDGGHAAVAAYEGIASKVQGKRVMVDYQKLIPVSALVLVIFLTLGVSAMVLDVRGLFNG